MKTFRIIDGDLLSLAKEGIFDVIAQGCNCLSAQESGIAKQMVAEFQTDKFVMENEFWGDRHNVSRLGNIDFELKGGTHKFYVVNCYSQYMYGPNHEDGVEKPLDYEALTLCLRKINIQFPGKKIGLPWIGCGLAGGDKVSVEEIIRKELVDCEVSIVNYKK